MMETGVREKEREIGRRYTAGFGDGGWGHEPRDVGCLLKLEMSREQILPWNPKKEHSPGGTLSLAEQNPFWSISRTFRE